MPGELAFQKDTSAIGSRRDRKKLQTRHAIEDAALELFAERGFDATTVEDIAARADVAPATFFRHFPTKADVIHGEHGERLPELIAAISARPASEPDVQAMRAALVQEWVPAIDAQRTGRATLAIESSPVLTGHASRIGHEWMVAASTALAGRRGLTAPDRASWMATTMAMSTFGDAVKHWLSDGSRGELRVEVERWFDELVVVCAATASEAER